MRLEEGRKSKPSSPAAQRKKSEEEEVEVVVENDGGKAGAVAEGGEETVEALPEFAWENPTLSTKNYEDLVRGGIVTAKSAERERKIEELKKEWKARDGGEGRGRESGKEAAMKEQPRLRGRAEAAERVMSRRPAESEEEHVEEVEEEEEAGELRADPTWRLASPMMIDGRLLPPPEAAPISAERFIGGILASSAETQRKTFSDGRKAC
ncbi:hypothetical protein FOZ60_005640 [Perkinsus olseni]|uniref:Uncharacterized protein n=1 Tax=Perkinsus olseni TaxID=32597 RepID=A0A7J6NQF9_PEROL|nr:hypothetical protein FOZ60_005640 [Perkinsus olseni]